jgi:hypothetical protein
MNDRVVNERVMNECEVVFHSLPVMNPIPPGCLSPEEATRRDFVTHDQAWQIVVPDVLVIPMPSVLFWQRANQCPTVIYPDNKREALIPRVEAPHIFPEWLIRDMRKNQVAILKKRVHNNTVHAVNLRKQLAELEAMIGADKAALTRLHQRKGV